MMDSTKSRRHSVAHAMKPLDQLHFKSKLINDPMEKEPDQNRRALFQCLQCDTIYENDVISERGKQDGYCWVCYQRTRYPNFMEDYDAIKWLLENKPSDSKSGYFGVRQAQYSDNWVAEIKLTQKKTTRIGTYDTKQEAALAYDKYVHNNYLDRQTNVL